MAFFLEFFIRSRIVPRSDNIVYLGIRLKFGLQLLVDSSDRCRKFMAFVSSVSRPKVKVHEDVFSDILIKKCSPVLNYGVVFN